MLGQFVEGWAQALENRVNALERRCSKIACVVYGEMDRRTKDHEQRIAAIERLLNHKGGAR